MIVFVAVSLSAPLVQVETDPSTFALHGGAAHVRLAVPGHEQTTLGVGAYAMDMPGPLLSLAPDNRGEGWHGNLLGVGLFADRYLQRPVDGVHVGTQVALHRWHVDNDAGEAAFTSVLVMPRVGWLWTPFDRLGLYVDPWVGIGATVPVSGDRTVGDDAFALFPVMAFGALHVGWRFGG